MCDVIVVGGGPAGTAVAKRCAEYGLHTLILERRSLPRYKICSGMIMGPVAHTLVKQEYGELPETILSEPTHLLGHIFHVPDIGTEQLDSLTPLTHREDLDYWMNQKAQAKGVEIWEASRALDLREKGRGFSVTIEKDNEKQELEAKFVVGADGFASVIRKSLFPGFKVSYNVCYEEHYQGGLDLDKRYFHWFRLVEPAPLNFAVHHKGDVIIIDAGGRRSQARESLELAKDFLAKNYDLDTSQKPVWRSACPGLSLYDELFSRTFLPAKGNALLVGNAAGLMLPVTGEGIGSAIKSGLLAADSIIKATESGQQPDKIYLAQIEGILSAFKEIYPWSHKIEEERKSGGHSLPEVLRNAFQSTLRDF